MKYAGKTYAEVWDLRRIRSGLKRLGLDWPQLDLPPASDPSLSLPIRLRVQGPEGKQISPGDSQWLKTSGTGPKKRDWGGEIARSEGSLAGSGDRSLLLNNLAWLLVIAPPDARDPERALGLVEESLRLRPEEPSSLNTLGVVYYRLARYGEAIEALLKPRQKGVQPTAYDLFFIPMSFARQGQHPLAQDAYLRAFEWIEQSPSLSEAARSELQEFQAEAAEAVGIR